MRIGTKIGDFAAAVVEEDVFGLEVAMKRVLRMHITDSPRNIFTPSRNNVREGTLNVESEAYCSFVCQSSVREESSRIFRRDPPRTNSCTKYNVPSCN